MQSGPIALENEAQKLDAHGERVESHRRAVEETERVPMAAERVRRGGREMEADDIYRFRYNAANRKRLGFSADHCFEGLLRARPLGNGQFLLIDTYWGIEGQGRSFTPEEAEAQGSLTFYCNLNDIEPINEYEQVYFADDDLFRISEQHACVPRCVHWFKRKGAMRNADKMLRVINERTEIRQWEIESATRDLDRLAELKQQVNEGNLEIYL